MASIAIRRKILVTSLPHFLTCGRFGFRTICSGRIGVAPSPSLPLSDYDNHAGTKVLEKFTEEFEIGSKKITLETGKLARFANGAVLMGMDETKVLSTVASGKGDSLRDFLPLTVDYQEKHFAQGMIPNTFMRREGAPKERELLCGRLIDRPIRPLFPAGFYHEVQVTASVLSSDGKQDPDIMAANATSAALMLSDIPWGGPIGMIRIGRISGEFIVNPSVDEDRDPDCRIVRSYDPEVESRAGSHGRSEVHRIGWDRGWFSILGHLQCKKKLSLSDLNLVYACTKDKTLMIDVQAREISERDLGAALKLAHPEAVKYLEPQIRLASRAGKGKKEYKLSLVSKRTFDKIKDLTEAPIAAVFTDPSYGKFERGEALEKIGQDAKRALEEECDEDSLKVLSKTVDTVRKEVVRRRIIAEGYRLDGRSLDEVRPLFCEAGTLPQLHGSSLFSRGDTQVLCTVTLGAPGDAQHLDSLVGPSSKRFMLHYSFPPFCINEVGKRTGLNRREVGHGTLAEKSLLAVLPPEDDLPYTVRINSEVMASDGSTSMATVCGGSMALMDAGIPLKDHVAGVSVGLVSDIDPSTGEIKDYRILTDILGLEDHLGDMDFKIAGTRNGITASQLDIKPAGIPLDIICEALEPALKARLQILDHMEQEINAPRTQNDRNSPRIVTLKYSNDALRQLIGPLGSLKRKIEEETGARMSVSDGTLTIVAKDQSVLEKVLEKVDFIVGREVEVGGTYKGVVTSIKEYGAFVEFNGGQQGLLHISELSHEPVTRISDVVSIGQKLSLKCIGQDLRGNIKLSLKETQPRKKSTGSVADLSAHIKEVLNVEEPVKYVANDVQEKQSSTEGEEDSSESETSDRISSHCMTPSVVIRSAEECDKDDKSAKLNQKLKAKPKRSSPTVSAPKQTTGKRSKSGSKKEIVSSDTENDSDDKEARKYSTDEDTALKTVVDARNLKLGMEVTAKVHQVRVRGLVLDLGPGVHGMYRFEDGGRREFEIGEELRVKCSSFSAKGIPVLSIVEEED